MVRLIAIDLDGTLLNADKEISERNKRAIALAKDQGVKIVVCSGRVYRGARLYAKQIGSEDPIISCNGAVISENTGGRKLYANFLNRDDCLKIVELCQKHDVYYHIYAGDTMLTEKLGFTSLRYFERNKNLPVQDRVHIEIVENMSDKIEDGLDQILKFVMITNHPGQLKRVRNDVERVTDGAVDVMSSNFDNIEVVNKGVNKGAALKRLSEMMGIAARDMMAIGDNENDISMLRYAGLSVAMANGEDCAKSAARYITLSNNEDGVAEAIEKFVLTKCLS